jgi:excisionase family DNA binding protein
VIEYMTTAEVAARLGNRIKPRTVVDWIHAGKLPAIRSLGARGHFLIDPADVEYLFTYTPEAEQP